MLTALGIAGTILFGVISVYLSFKEEKTRKELGVREKTQKRRLYEIETLRAIQDRIGYSLNVERVIDTITGTLKNLFPYSTASSMSLEQNKLVFKIDLTERVSNRFVSEVKKSMAASLATLLGVSLPPQMEEMRTGLLPDDSNEKILASFFHIPLIVNGEIVGLINVSSTKPGLYKDEDMTILYQMTSLASSALSKLRSVIATEEGKLLAMIKSLRDGIILIDERQTLTLINQSARDLLAIPEHITKPTTFDIISMLSKETDLGAKLQKVITENTSITQNDVKIGDKLVQVFITPVLGSTDEKNELQVLGATILLHDVTLEHSLSQMKEDFTNNLVHELRAPITAIKSGAEVILQENNLQEEQAKLLTIINEQAKRLLDDISSLLDAAKMEAGSFVVSPQALEIEPIVKQVVSLFEPQAKQKNIELLQRISPNLPQGLLDKERIVQVLDNLLSNSIKFTPSGGNILVLVEEQNHQHLPEGKINPSILISVSDTGSGIPADKQHMLFSKFTQLNTNHLPQAQAGTGLGLYIAKGIVEAHGGSIYLSSSPGKGTTVSFTIPLAPKEIQHPSSFTPLVKDLLPPVHQVSQSVN